MRACASVFALGTTALVLSFGTAGCGGGAQSEPAPAVPAAESAESSAAPSSEPATTPADAPAAKTEAAKSDEAAPAGDSGGDSRSTETIAAVVKMHRKEARDCYEKTLKQVPGLKGDLVIHFTLTPEGKIKQAELNKERSTITEGSLTTCVIDVLRALSFPASSKGMETSVNYPFNFNP